jgi:hypothetical protein
MTASLLTPLTNGIQDDRLFARKSFGTFLRLWKKTTRFATAWHRVEFNSLPTFGRTAIADLPTKGHLVARIYFACELPALPAGTTYTHSVGHALLDDIQVLLGGKMVDRLDGRLLEVLDEFYTPLEKVGIVNRLIGRSEGASSGAAKQLYIPLPFWFSGPDPHLWFPIDAVNIDRLSVQVSLRELAALVSGPDAAATAVTGTLGDPHLLVEYIYLDTYEANRLRVTPIEVPITQHIRVEPFAAAAGTEARIPLRLGNPTKSIFFFAQRTEAAAAGNFFGTSVDLSAVPVLGGAVKVGKEPVRSVALLYNGGQVRYQTSFMDLFRVIAPALECRKSPAYNNYFYYMGFDIGNHDRRRGIPCGEANLDRLGEAEMRVELRGGGGADEDFVPQYNIHIYAMTYNILSIYGGRAALLFAY